MTGSSAGIPTNRQRPVTTLAMVFVFGIFENRNRSKARPSIGAITTTASRKAAHTGNPWFCTNHAMTNADA